MVGYIASGWCVIAAIVPLVRRMALPGVILLILGGVFYTAGVLFYRKKVSGSCTRSGISSYWPGPFSIISVSCSMSLDNIKGICHAQL